MAAEEAAAKAGGGAGFFTTKMKHIRAAKNSQAYKMAVAKNMAYLKGRMSTRTGKRSYSWRADKPSTLIYVKALDGGDPAFEANYRDEVFEIEAPFSGEGKSLVKTTNRFSGIDWGTENTAIVYDYWWDTRNRKAYVFNPSNSTSKPKVLYDRNYQDIYSDPGSFLKTRNTFNKSVLMLYKGNAYLRGAGFSKEGQFPFIDKLNITTLNKSRVYQSKYTDKVEAIQDYNPSINELIVLSLIHISEPTRPY